MSNGEANEQPRFIDSDVLIDYLRGKEYMVNELIYLKREATLAVSLVVRMELILGSNSRENLQRTEKLLRRFQVMPLTEEIGRVADQLIIAYTLSHGLRLADALIAAAAIVHDAPLLTKNQRDFRYLPGLKLLPYPEQL